MIEDFPEYIIKERKGNDGEIMYYVKWIGCDGDDNTWETESKMMAEWPTALIQYKKEKAERGGREKPEKRHTLEEEQAVFAYTSSVENWEEAVREIQYVEKSKMPGLTVYVDWKNGYKSVHHSSEIYAKCPQKMIEYFEMNLKFSEILD